MCRPCLQMATVSTCQLHVIALLQPGGTSRQLHTSAATCRCPQAAQHMVAHTVSAALSIRLPLLQPQLLQMVRPATPTTPRMGTTDCQQGQLLSRQGLLQGPSAACAAGSCPSAITLGGRQL